MEMISVQSSSLRSVGFDPTTSTLRVQFVKGKLYEYAGVPLDVYRSLLDAPSLGQYFNRYIRNIYPYRRLA